MQMANCPVRLQWVMDYLTAVSLGTTCYSLLDIESMMYDCPDLNLDLK